MVDATETRPGAAVPALRPGGHLPTSTTSGAWPRQAGAHLTGRYQHVMWPLRTKLARPHAPTRCSRRLRRGAGRRRARGDTPTLIRAEVDRPSRSGRRTFARGRAATSELTPRRSATAVGQPGAENDQPTDPDHDHDDHRARSWPRWRRRAPPRRPVRRAQRAFVFSDQPAADLVAASVTDRSRRRRSLDGVDHRHVRRLAVRALAGWFTATRGGREGAGPRQFDGRHLAQPSTAPSIGGGA